MSGRVEHTRMARDPRLRHAHLRAPWNRLHAMRLDGADRPLAEKDAGGAFDERGWRGSHESRHPPSVLTARAARMTSCSPSHASSARVAGETLDARDDAGRGRSQTTRERCTAECYSSVIGAVVDPFCFVSCFVVWSSPVRRARKAADDLIAERPRLPLDRDSRTRKTTSPFRVFRVSFRGLNFPGRTRLRHSIGSCGATPPDSAEAE